MKQPVIVPEWLLSHIAKEEPQCIDRIRWEIENSIGKSRLVSEWPTRKISMLANGKEYFMYNSFGQWIATFKLKKIK